MEDAARLAKYAFISCAREDSAAADVVQAALERAGIRVWRDSAEVWPGEDWPTEIRRAVSGDALAFLALFSQAGLALERSGQREELLLAVEEMRLREPAVPWLIPVRLDDCGVPDLSIGAGRTLRSLRPADIFGAHRAAELERLVGSVLRILGREQIHAVDGIGQDGAAYLQQVRRIAPPKSPGLLSRDAELRELADFCSEADRGSYVWWRGGAWAGKSALLSTFVLRPPREIADRVQIVSFFITSRLAAQDGREAFIQVLLDQLAAITLQDLPAVLSETTRDALLLDLLTQAALKIRDSGRRLVLVVDGLDEDRSVTTGPAAHSIAGMLPADPPAGMRVIVSGRPDPPIPDDVPDWHPLRDPAIVRPLDPSPHARDIARLARQELHRLLHGTQAEQDVLGFLTAARGGLTASDLGELTALPLWEVEDILRHAQGRTFTSLPRHHRPGATGQVYLLGHEELQATAGEYLAARLPSHRQKLSAWADSWRDAGWPLSTPEYLLAGYYQLLLDLGDLPAMTALACDTARHDRMLDLTGGDAAALAEVRSSLDRIAAHEAPDLTDALYLAWHRDRLTDRNARIPHTLPAVWASIGNTARAIALATSIPEPGRQAWALAQVADALARNGQLEQAESIARSISSPSRQAWALAQVAGAQAGAGHRDQAAAVTRSISDPGRRAWAMAKIGDALARNGQLEEAETIARSISSPRRRAWALAQVADALAGNGQPERALAIAESISSPGRRAWALAQIAGTIADVGQHDQAEAIARSFSDPGRRAQALARVASALAEAGHRERAATVISQAEAEARSISDPGRQAQALAHVASALASTGQHERSDILARSISDSGQHAQALVHVANALAGTGQRDRAIAAAVQAEAEARSVTDPGWRAQALAHVAKALAGAGHHEQAASAATQAEVAARAIIDTRPRDEALARLAGALARAGQYDQAAAVARSIIDAGQQGWVFVQVAVALAENGQGEHAEVVAQSLTDPDLHAVALAHVAAALARAGQHEQAVAAASRAESATRSITSPGRQASALLQVAEALARAGQYEQAAVAARQAGAEARLMANPGRQALALVQVAGALAMTGQHEQAVAATDQAETVIRSITNPSLQAWALVHVAHALAAAGQHNEAEAAARSITNPGRQGQALVQVAGALARAGQYEQAEAVARSITSPTRQALALGHVAVASAGSGLAEQARKVANSITSPGQRSLALARVAAALAGAGQSEQAFTTARQVRESARIISEPDLQAETIAQIALALAMAGDAASDAASASQMTAAAFVAGNWTVAAVPALTLKYSAWTRLEQALNGLAQDSPVPTQNEFRT